MARAVPEEILHDGTVCVVACVVPAGGPADYLELMVISRADDIRAGIDETAHHVHVSDRSRPMQSISVVAALARVRVEPAAEKQIDDREMSLLCRNVE